MKRQAVVRTLLTLGGMAACGVLGFHLGATATRSEQGHVTRTEPLVWRPTREARRTPFTDGASTTTTNERADSETRSAEVAAEDPLDSIDWERHVPILIWKKELHRRGSVRPDPETMAAVAALMADLAPVCRALGVDDVNAALRHPAVQARILSTRRIGDGASSGEARGDLCGELLAFVPRSRMVVPSTPDPVADTQAALDMYRLVSQGLPPEARGSFDRLAEAVFFTGTEVRISSLRGQTLDLALSLFRKGWEDMRGVSLPQDCVTEGLGILRRWLQDGRQEFELLRLEYGKDAETALWEPEALRQAARGSLTIELRLRLRLAMARVQVRHEEALGCLLGEDANSRPWDSRVLIVAGP